MYEGFKYVNTCFQKFAFDFDLASVDGSVWSDKRWGESASSWKFVWIVILLVNTFEPTETLIGTTWNAQEQSLRTPTRNDYRRLNECSYVRRKGLQEGNIYTIRRRMDAITSANKRTKFAWAKYYEVANDNHRVASCSFSTIFQSEQSCGWPTVAWTHQGRVEEHGEGTEEEMGMSYSVTILLRTNNYWLQTAVITIAFLV